MSEIFGFLNKNSRLAEVTELGRMSGSERANKEWTDENLGFAFTPSIGLESFSQDLITSPCGNFTLLYDGQTHNFLEFLPALKAKIGSNFPFTESHVILRLLIEFGESVISQLEGAFVLAFWNKCSQKLILAKSQSESKSLFWAQNSDGVVFATNPGFLFRWGIEKNLDQEHLDELFFYRHISGENTIFKGVFRLLSGHIQTWSAKGELEKTELLSRSEKVEHPNTNIRKALGVPFKEEAGNSFKDSGISGKELFEYTRNAIQLNMEPLLDFSIGLQLGYSVKTNNCIGFSEALNPNFESLSADKIFGNRFRYGVFQMLKYFPENWLKSAEYKRLSRFLSFSNPDFHLLSFSNNWFLGDLREMGLRSLNTLTPFRIQILEEAKRLFPMDRLAQLHYLETHTIRKARKEEWTRVIPRNCSASAQEDGSGRLASTANEDFSLSNPFQAIDWNKLILSQPEFRDHLDTLVDSELLRIGWLRYLNVEKLVKDFKSSPQQNSQFIYPIFFHSLWYKMIFSE